MAYQECMAPPELAEYVDVFWSFEGPGKELDRIVPDGRCELLIHLGTPYRERDQNGRWRTQPQIVFAGQLTRPLWLTSAGPVAIASARIRPEAAGAIVGRPASDMTDQRMSLERIDRVAAARLQDTLRRSPSLERAGAALADLLVRRVTAGGLDQRVRQVVPELDRGTSGSLQSLAERHGISTRQLQRLFAWHVGIPPRLYLRIRRFRRVFGVLNEHRGTWARAAAEAGYFDQPELARDFRRFVGCTARQFHATQSRLSAGLTTARPMSQ